MTLSRLHPFTSLAVLLAVLALGLLGLHHGWVAACLFFVALGFSLLEFKKLVPVQHDPRDRPRPGCCA